MAKAAAIFIPYLSTQKAEWSRTTLYRNIACTNGPFGLKRQEEE